MVRDQASLAATTPCLLLAPVPQATLPAAASAGHHVILVSSGAVGVGCQRLGLKERPSALAQKQALAAVGQVHLMRFYEDLFNALGLVGGQREVEEVRTK